MLTRRTRPRRLHPLMNMPTLTAFPPYRLIPLKNRPLLNLLQKLPIPLLMPLLNLRNLFKQHRCPLLALFPSLLRKLRIHLFSLITFPLNRSLQIRLGVPDTLQQLKLVLRVLPLVLRSLLKNLSNIMITLLPRNLRKISILIPRLTLTSKRNL